MALIKATSCNEPSTHDAETKPTIEITSFQTTDTGGGESSSDDSIIQYPNPATATVLHDNPTNSDESDNPWRLQWSDKLDFKLLGVRRTSRKELYNAYCLLDTNLIPFASVASALPPSVLLDSNTIAHCQAVKTIITRTQSRIINQASPAVRIKTPRTLNHDLSGDLLLLNQRLESVRRCCSRLPSRIYANLNNSGAIKELSNLRPSSYDLKISLQDAIRDLLTEADCITRDLHISTSSIEQVD